MLQVTQVLILVSLKSWAAPSTICKLAKSWEADLIVVGHQGMSPLQELARGSVSNYVMHYAPCSVLTIQPT